MKVSAKILFCPGVTVWRACAVGLAAGAICGASIGTAGAAASATQALQAPSGSGQKPPVFNFKSYDLGKIIWYASADLPPDSSLEEIRNHGTPTTPTVTLRSAVQGGAGMLFCFVQLPDPLPAGCAGRLTIGDIDGNDVAYWNGKEIGSTSDWGIADVRPRMYLVEPSNLKPGINIFALRLSGPGGRPTFGIRSKTLTFCLTPRPDAAPLPPADNAGTSAVATINQSLARAAILESDPQASATLLQRKRPSFGRFGEFQHNGLPTVSEITPTRVATRNGPAFDVSLDGVQNVEVARGPEEPGIDGWHRLTRVRGDARGNAVSYLCRQNVLYPGAVFRLESGSVLEMRVRFPDKAGRVFTLSAEDMVRIFGQEKPPADLSLYGFLGAGENATPAIMAVSGLSVNVTQAAAQIDVSLARKSPTADGRVYIFYPAGLYQVSGSLEGESLLKLAHAVKPGEDPVSLMRKWLRLGLYEPVGVDEYFAPVNDDQVIRIYQAMRYRPAAGVDLGGPLLMRPPQVDFARQMLGYGLAASQLSSDESGETSSTGMLAFSGDIHFSSPINGPETTSGLKMARLPADQQIRIISYDLPVPPLQERAAVKMYGNESLVALVNESVLSDLGSSTSITAVDALYKSRAQSYQATSYLNPKQRDELQASSDSTIAEALGGHFWHYGVEPDSGLDYWYTSFLQGPYYKKYDQDLGNGLALYGLETYVKYSGEWKLPAKNWDAVERIFQWFTVTDDWEWMRASNSVHGYGTGSGDSQNATYAAAVAYAKLARGTGHQAEYYYGLYTMARAAYPSLNRFAYGDFATANKFKSNHSLVLGFHEGQGFLEAELEGYPWNATSNIAAQGVQSENFDLWTKSATDALRNYEQIFEKNFPDWVNGEYSYPYKTLYQGNSGAITLPHIYLRARLDGDSPATLADYLTSARTNNAFWWMAPPVIAQVLTRRADGVVVTDWGTAAFMGGKIEPTENDDRRKLTLWLDNITGKENQVSVQLPRKPYRFEINGGPVPLTDSQFEEGLLSLKLRRPGENVITVIYPRK